MDQINVSNPIVEAINKCANIHQVAGVLSTVNFTEYHPQYALDIINAIMAKSDDS